MTINRRRFLALAAVTGVVSFAELVTVHTVAAKPESKEDKVVRIAKSFVGRTNYYVSPTETYCLGLCNDVYQTAGYNFRHYANAAAAAAGMSGRIQKNSKKGCLMFWGAWDGNSAGHAAIFLGDGKVLTSYTYTKNKKVSIVSHDEILRNLPKAAWRGYLHIGDAIRFQD